MISIVTYTSTFKKQFKKYKGNLKVLSKYEERYEEILGRELSDLNPKRKNHKLTGDYQGFRELHLFPDVLMIYEVRSDRILLVQIGSHSDLFG